jgi:hypothetical protein
MRGSIRSWNVPLVVTLACVIFPLAVSGADDTQLTKEQIKAFLRTAPVIKDKPSSKGITHPSHLTLSDGTITHDASFQAIDEHKSQMKMESGKLEFGFVDSYKYNVAAYQLAELLGVEDIMPVYVERKWQGKTGSISWWLPVKMDEADRVKNKIAAPDTEKWNRQMYRIRVFDELIYDSDANLTNVLIGEDWKIWRVDFSRAFRINKELHDPKNLVMCEHELFEKLKSLTADQVRESTKPYLGKDQINGLMARRDKIVATFETMIKQKGEKEILF